MRGLAAGTALFAALVVAASAQAGAAPADGATLFKQNCSACHQAAGQGIPGAFPPLAGSAFVQGDPKAVAGVLLNGRGGMPNFREDMSNDEIASVLTYVRTAWGNTAAPIDVATVASAQGGGGSTVAPSVLPYH